MVDAEQQPLLRDASHSTLDANETQGNDVEEDEAIAVPKEPDTKALVVTLGSVWIGVFLAALDATIVATLSGPISTSFKSFKLLSWLATAYLIANAALQPLSGRLTDIYSRRTGLIFSNAFFALGNLICGLAQSEWMIILGRIVAGMGGG